MRELIVNFFQKKLVEEMNQRHKFVRCGPHSFIFVDGIDTIFVQVEDKNVFILSDGFGSISSIQVINVLFPDLSDYLNEHLDQTFLQPILHLF